MTDPFRAIALGVVQGLTEFIPVSSSAHLVILPWIAGWEGSGLAFDVALQLGTLFAVFAYFWRDLLSIIVGTLRAPFTRGSQDMVSLRLALYLALGSVPAAVVGFVFEEPIDAFFHSGERSAASLLVIAFGLAIVGLVLIAADRLARPKKDILCLSPWAVLFIGSAQALALVPGVSRSGATIAAALIIGMYRPEAARFSFLLSVPIIIGAALLAGLDILQTGLPRAQWLAFAAGIGSAAVVGYLSIRFLLEYLKKHSFAVFAIYRLALAGIIVSLLLSGFNVA